MSRASRSLVRTSCVDSRCVNASRAKANLRAILALAREDCPTYVFGNIKLIRDRWDVAAMVSDYGQTYYHQLDILCFKVEAFWSGMI